MIPIAEHRHERIARRWWQRRVVWHDHPKNFVTAREVNFTHDHPGLQPENNLAYYVRSDGCGVVTLAAWFPMFVVVIVLLVTHQ